MLRSKKSVLLAVVGLLSFSVGENIQAADSCPKPPAAALPRRPVVITGFSATPFEAPNAKKTQIDLRADLLNMVATELSRVSAGAFSYIRSRWDAPNACDTWINLRAALTVLELDIRSVKVKFGFSGNQAVPVGQSVTGEVGVRVGKIGLDFGLQHCKVESCQEIASTFVDQSTLSGEVRFTVNFDKFQVGPEILWNTSLSAAIRQLMGNAIRQLVASPQVSSLPWYATVRKVDQAKGMVLFDSGSDHNIFPAQNFTVYALDSAGSACGVNEAVAQIKTAPEGVFGLGSWATIEQLFNEPRGVRINDVVRVRAR